jgi:tetratricopeptide (TPR) repeat protein
MNRQLRQKIIISCALCAVTFTAYWPALHCEFVDYDDSAYVTANRHVRNGLTREGVEWAFTRLAGEDTYWHPVTWLSHMVDCQLFGVHAGAHHLVNVAFHIANVLLLFSILLKLTSMPGRSAVAAALFALHPLQVDTVAWIAERKNLLSVLFCLLSIQAYIRYVRTPKDSRRTKVIAFAATLLFFALGLMAKPSVVILPFVMLLLDFWPLRRYVTIPAVKASWSRLVMEKIPMFALSVASSVITILAHKRLGLIASSDELPFLHRTANAIVSYCGYLGKFVWPSHLAVYYPYPSTLPVAVLAAAALVLGVITALAVLTARKRPYLIVGWFWYLGALVPAIGIIQASSQAMADRFVYFPIIGLAIMAVWGCFDMLSVLRFPRTALVSMAAVVILLCGALTAHQCCYWQNSLTLFGHAVAATHDNYLAHVNYGAALKARGFNPAAKTNFLEALRLKPSSPEALNGLGVICFEEGDAAAAISNFVAALKIKPAYAEAHNNLGNALALQGNHAEASAEYVAALSLNPNYAEAHNNLGRVFEMKGQIPEAVAHYGTALEINPTYVDAHLNIGKCLLGQANVVEALPHFVTALKLNPNLIEARYQFANALIQQRNYTEALDQFASALHKKPTDAEVLGELARASVAQNKLDVAIDYLSRGLRSSPNDPSLHSNLGNCYAMRAEYDKAEAEYRSALKLKPDFADAYFNLGNVLNLRAKPDDAMHNYREAIRLKPDYIDARMNLAQLLQQQGDAAGARIQCAEVLRYQPENPEAKRLLNSLPSASPKHQ